MTSVEVVIPALDEEPTIGIVIADLAAELPDACFVIVDNGSTDATADVAGRACAEAGVDHRILRVERRGKGNAVRAAFRESRADVVVMIDADATYPAKAVHDLIGAVTSGAADMAVGDRHSSGAYGRENSRSFHGTGNRLVQSTVNRLFDSSLHDILSGYRAFSRAFVLSYPLMVEGFALEVDLTAHALDKRMRVVEVPVDYRERPPGSHSKLRTFRDGSDVMLTLVNLYRRYRPLSFFGATGALFCALSAVAAIRPVADYLTDGFVYHVPLSILAAALAICGLLSFSTALILDGIAGFARRSAELHLLHTLSTTGAHRDPATPATASPPGHG